MQTIFWQFGNSCVCPMIANDLKSEHTSPTITHNLKSECTSPMIMQGDQTTYQTIGNIHNNSITRGEQSYHDLAMI